MKTILITLSILIISNLSADWQVVKREVTIVAPTQKTASITNNVGDILSIYRAIDGNVWCSFKVFESNTFAPYWVKAPVLVIDDHKTIDLASRQTMQSSFGFHSYDWTKDQLNFRISPAKIDQLISDTLFALMTGDKLTVQYYLRTGVKMNSTFSLIGANIAIAELLEINPNMDIADHAIQKEFHFAKVNEILRCSLNLEEEINCYDTAYNCAELAYPNIQQYRVCIDGF